jgi:hypothetical protein
MTLPSILLGLIIALLIGSLFHLFLGGGLGRLIFYLILSLIGFVAGQFVGSWRNWILLPIGTLNFGMTTLGSLVLLLAGYWFSLVKIRPNNGDDEI